MFIFVRGKARIPSFWACACVIALLSLATPAHATFPGQNGKIAFTSNRDGNLEIYAMNPDGSGPTRITTNAVADQMPAWSPDGGKIAFATNRDGNFEIYVMDADGTNQTRLTDNAADDEYPAWSPDGQKLAFVGERDGNEEIYTMNADGSSQVNLTNNSTDDVQPDWSPDGAKIIYTAYPQGATAEIYVMNPDGSGQSNLTNHPYGDSSPTWSPDGQRIAFRTDRDGNSEIYAMNPDGSNLTRITFNTFIDSESDWSPDGTQIVFRSNRGQGAEIYTMNIDGSSQLNRTNNPALDSFPNWQPLVGSNPPPPYEAPRLASPVSFALVPVFKQCATPGNPVNGNHSPPAVVGSCIPPQPGSIAQFGPQAAGYARLAVIYGDTNTANGDQADVTVAARLSDIRTASGIDYDPATNAPDTTLVTRLRFTDRDNGGSGSDPGTTTDMDFSVPVDCNATADPSLGSSCSVDTTLDALLPGRIKENKATLLQSFRFRVNDSGVNGVRGDSDDRGFATQGFYVP